MNLYEMKLFRSRAAFECNARNLQSSTSPIESMYEYGLSPKGTQAKSRPIDIKYAFKRYSEEEKVEERGEREPFLVSKKF
jgi:hypothetical protein